MMEEKEEIEELKKQKKEIEQKIKEEKKSKQTKQDKKKWHQNLFKKEKFKKPSKVGVLFLRKNGTAEPMEREAKNGMFEVDGQTYHERRDCTYFFGKDRVPLAVISEGGFIPFGTAKWYEKDMLSKFHEAQDHLLRGIRHAELVRAGGMGVSPNTKKMIGIGLLVLVGLVILFNYI